MNIHPLSPFLATSPTAGTGVLPGLAPCPPSTTGAGAAETGSVGGQEVPDRIGAPLPAPLCSQAGLDFSGKCSVFPLGSLQQPPHPSHAHTALSQLAAAWGVSEASGGDRQRNPIICPPHALKIPLWPGLMPHVQGNGGSQD